MGYRILGFIDDDPAKLWQFGCALSAAIAGLAVPRADVALVYSPPLPLALSAWAWRALRRTPWVVNVQDLFPQSAIDLGVLRSRVLIRAFEALERFTYRSADAITVHSRGNREHVLAHGGSPGNSIVMHNAVDIDYVRPEPKESALRRELGLDGQFVVSFAGVMGHSQDLDVVLRAAHLLRDCPDVHFLLVGEGVQKERLVQESAAMGLGNVTWLPMQPRERYPSILHASDVGLATLYAEVKTPVVPSKILSIMSAGRPVVAALDLLGDAPKLIERARSGLCVAPGEPSALAEALLRLYRDPALRCELGDNGRRFAEAHLSQRAVAESYVDLFERVIAEHGGNR